MKHKAWVWKRVTFDAAHQLPDYPGDCSRIHGHTYIVEVGVEGEIDEETGMVIDLADVGEFLYHGVLARFDHHFINEKLGGQVTTAENLARDIWQQGWRYFSGRYNATDLIVRVFETPDSWVEFRKPEAPTKLHPQEVS